jgi:hypothetical protein
MKSLLTSILTATALSIVVSGQANGQASKKPTMTITSLTCKGSTERVDQIEVRVYSGSREIFKRHRAMKFKSVWNFDKIITPLSNDVRIEIWEIDNELFGKDDKLGSLSIKRGKTPGAWKVTFSGTDRGPASNAFWQYELRYRVDR